MKKRLLALSMAMIMAVGSLAGCGEDKPAGGDPTQAPDNQTEATPTEKPVLDENVEVVDISEEEEGKVLNIYCWNDEFANRLADHYPGFTKKSDNVMDGGTIGDITVNFVQTASKDNAYQNKLDQVLPKNEDAAADDKVDLFLVEADYALKYVNSGWAMPVTDLGIELSEFSNQYKYTKDVMTSSDGKLMGVSWQGCPGVLIYNRAAATEVLGSDDPETVQDAVKDWDTFTATAATMKEKGYMMTATVNDSFRVFSNNMSKPWVQDEKIVIDDNIKTWVDMSKQMVDAKQTTTDDLWSDGWSAGFYPEGKVFCYFGPAWMINFSMKAEDEKSIAAQGGWGAVEGPQGFYWGGTWIAAANGTDNKATVADIMRKLTTDETIMTDIVKKDSDFVNNKPAMEKAATDDSYAFAVLGGQNPLAMFAAGADKIDLSNMSAYDQGLIESFQNAMKDYFLGNVDYDAALENFYKDVKSKYPELSH